MNIDSWDPHNHNAAMSVRGSKVGFSLVELLVVIAVLAVLISIVIPSAATLRGQSEQTRCAGNLRNVMMVFNAYAADRDKEAERTKQVYFPENGTTDKNVGNEGCIPIGIPQNPYVMDTGTGRALVKYLDALGLEPDIFYCPNLVEQVPEMDPGLWDHYVRDGGTRFHGISNHEFAIGYSYVANAQRIDKRKHQPARYPVQEAAKMWSVETDIMADTCAAWRPTGQFAEKDLKWRTFPHDGIDRPRASNILRGDGSVESRPLEELRWGYKYYHGVNTFW